jgi:23S rRNA U2552 (ribose-2'-O)-methylase RlmE/FtsJ
MVGFNGRAMLGVEMMPIEPIKEFSLVECEAEADVYLKSLLNDPENRSMDVIHRDAEQINDPRFRAYYVNKGREMLKEGYGIG